MSDKVLINKISYRFNTTEVEIKSFDSFENLMHFCIDSDLNYDENKTIPRLALPTNKTRLQLDLEEGFSEAVNQKKLITNYEEYRNQKWIHFLNCLNNNEIIANERPNFVSFGGNISDILCAYYQCFGPNYLIFAQRFKDVIYLNKRANLKEDEDMTRNINKYSYYGLKFLHLISDRNVDNINEFEKHFNVDRLQLKDQKIIVLNEIDAIDENGNLFDAKARQLVKTVRTQESYYRNKLLSDWSQCITRGVKTVIFGNRDESVLKDIGEEEVAAIPQKCCAYWSDMKCFQFTERILNFMNICVEEELTLYEFNFDYKMKSISCYKRLSNEDNALFLPHFYIK